MSSKNQDCVVYGVDIGKTLFHVCGCDRQGKPVYRKKFSRRTVTRFFANAPEALIGMEACPGSQWLARRLVDLGHDARIMPAQFVKPYLNRQKNDANDAQAIAEAVQRPTMRFVAIKRLDQVDTQALHRVRDRLVRQRTQIVSQTRGLCLEYGLTMARGVPTFCRDMPRLLENPCDALTPRMLRILHALWEGVAWVLEQPWHISTERRDASGHR